MHRSSKLNPNQINIITDILGNGFILSDDLLLKILKDIQKVRVDFGNNESEEEKTVKLLNYVNYIYSDVRIFNVKENLVNLSKLTFYVLIKLPTIKGMHDFLSNLNHNEMIAKSMYYSPQELSDKLNLLENHSVLNKLTLASEKTEKDSVRYAEVIIEILANIDQSHRVGFINMPNKVDDTPLQNASWNGHIKMVESLLKFKDIDIHARDVNHRDSALDMAKKNKREKIAALLESKGTLRDFTLNGKELKLDDLVKALNPGIGKGEFSILPIDNHLAIYVKDSSTHPDSIQIQLMDRKSDRAAVYLEKETIYLSKKLSGELDIEFDSATQNMRNVMILQKSKLGRAYSTKILQENKVLLFNELKEILQGYFDFDKKTLVPCSKPLNQSILDKINETLFKLAELGFSGYATELAVLLNKNGIRDRQVDGYGCPVDSLTRVNTFTIENAAGRVKDPNYIPIHSSKVRFWDKYNFNIYSGYRSFRIKNSINRTVINNEDSDDENLEIKDPKQVFDAEYTESQMEDYNNRKNSIKRLHSEGNLFIRVTDAKEIIKFAGFQYLWNNTCLSTSLLPKQESILNMQLFNEGQEAIGILIDPSRVSMNDYGATYYRNAFTRNDGFEKQASRRITDKYAANGWLAQKEFLEELEKLFYKDLSVQGHNLKITKKNNDSGWNIASSKNSGNEGPIIQWNETTWYRAAERDLTVGLFVKKDHLDYTQNLRNLIKIQSLIRRKKGLYLPIFHFDGKLNKLNEVIVDDILIAFLELSKTVVAQPNSQHDNLAEQLSKEGLNISEVSKAVAGISDSPKLKEFFEILLMSMSLDSPSDSISFSHNNSFSDVRLVDSFHLLFPGNFKTANAGAIKADFAFTDTDIKNLNRNPESRNLLKVIMKRNLNFFLGIKIDNKSSKIKLNKEIANKYGSSDLDKKDYTRVLTRALKSMYYLKFFTISEVERIIKYIRKDYPSLGIEQTQNGLQDSLILDIKSVDSIQEGVTRKKYEVFALSDDDDLESVVSAAATNYTCMDDNNGTKYQAGPRFRNS